MLGSNHIGFEIFFILYVDSQESWIKYVVGFIVNSFIVLLSFHTTCSLFMNNYYL